MQEMAFQSVDLTIFRGRISPDPPTNLSPFGARALFVGLPRRFGYLPAPLCPAQLTRVQFI